METIFKRCAVADCDGNAHWKARGSLGFCHSHYRRMKRHGDPTAGRTPEGEPERYLREVVLQYNGDECLSWPYARASNGYAHLRRDGCARLVSRIVCEVSNGPPPSVDAVAAHSCGNGHLGCVSKRHLSWKDQAGNEADKLAHGTSNRGERCGAAKLSRIDVNSIRSLRGRVTGASLAAKYGVDATTISSIQNGKTWSWLKAEDTEPGAEG